MNESYNEYRKKMQQEADAYQAFVEEVFYKEMGIEISCYKTKGEQYLIGENRAGVEIKFDRQFRNYHPQALWIEYAEKKEPRDGDYVSAGIFRNDNSWLYVIGDRKTIFIFGKKTLQRLYRQNEKHGWWKLFENKTKTSRGLIFLLTDAYKFAEKVIEVETALDDEEFANG